MAEHVHGCLKCRPEMVPDFNRNDERYHERPKCGVRIDVGLDGDTHLLTTGSFEGPEGWVLFAGATSEDVHMCPSHPDAVCVEPRFGRVEVVHECPTIGAALQRQIEEDILSPFQLRIARIYSLSIAQIRALPEHVARALDDLAPHVLEKVS